LRAVLERLGGDVLAKPAVDGGLTNTDLLRVQARQCVGQQLVLSFSPGLPAAVLVARMYARAGRILGDLAHLVHVPELGAL